MSGWNESVWFAQALAVALKSSVILGGAWALSMLFRSRSAAMRHLVWTGAAAAILLLPFLSLSLPALPVQGGSALLTNLSVSATGTPSKASNPSPSSTVARSPGHAAPRSAWIPGWRLLLMLLWIAGVAVASVRMLVAAIGVHRIRRAASPWPDRDLVAELANRLGIDYPVHVFETAPGTMPVAFGLAHPAVLIPRDAAEWTEERRRVVLLHELAHVRRGDLATHLLARLALILNWWNPLAWIAWREFLKEGERAADDLVLSAGPAAPDYAEHLLAVARTLQTVPARATAALAMARRSQLEARLVAILDSRVNRRAAGRGSAFAAAVLALALVVPLAALRAQDDSSPAVPPDMDATLKAAHAQRNFKMLDAPAAALISAHQYELAKKVLLSGAAIREQVSGSNSVDYGVGLTKLADLEMRESRYGNAESLYTKAVSSMGDQPEAAPALIKLGVIMLHNKNPDAALDYFERAQRVNPSGAGPAWTWIAVANRENPAEAEANFRSAMALEKDGSPESATTMELFAALLKTQGREPEAQSLAARANAIRSALAPQRKTTPGVYRIGGAVQSPKPISKTEPEYTEEARLAKYQGTVVLYVEIGIDGVPRNIQVARGLGMGLDDNAVAAIGTWRFQPGVKDGSPVPVMATIEVNFRLM